MSKRKKGRPFSRVLAEGGSAAPGSGAAMEKALDEMFPPLPEHAAPEEDR